MNYKKAAAAACLMLLAGCGGGVPDDFYDDAQRAREPRGESGLEQGSPLQCVPYAREQSGIAIYGDAYTWWGKAEGRYERGYEPEPGAVMVLHNYAGPRHGHVAVVREIVSSREIRIDHANWMNDGAVYINNPVRDESPANDWSRVRVFNIQSGGWGGKIYPVQGFILPNGSRPPRTDRAPSDRDGDLLLAKFRDALASPIAEAAEEKTDGDNY